MVDLHEMRISEELIRLAICVKGSSCRMAPSDVECEHDLFCTERFSEDEGDLVDDLQNDAFQGFSAESKQAISALLEKECQHMPAADYVTKFRSKGLNAGARQHAISWMKKVQSFYKLRPLSVALSVNYMDRFLSKRKLPQGTSWNLQLLSVACMSLAAKMDSKDVPTVLELQVFDEIIFEKQLILKIELLVSSTLKWRMSAITPFSYTDYYIQPLRIGDTALKSLLERVSELIMGTLTNVDFVQFRASNIAAAAFLYAVNEIVPGQAPGYKKILCEVVFCTEDVDRFCHLVEELLMTPSFPRTSLIRTAFCSSSISQSPIGVLEAATVSCALDSTHGSPENCQSLSRLVLDSTLKKRRRGEL